MLILVGRSAAKCAPVVAAIHSIDPAVAVKFVEADLSSLASVRAAAASVVADPGVTRIDVVINNAGVMAAPLTRSADGHELQLAVDHLAHFVLTNALRPKLAPGGGARVVNLASSMHRYSGVRWADPDFREAGSYTPWLGYGQAKTCNVLFSVGLRARGVRAYSLHPGSVASGLQAHLTPELVDDAVTRLYGPDKSVMANMQSLQPKTPQQGCATTLVAALDPSLPDEKPGRGVFLQDCGVVVDDAANLAEWAVDEKDAERCWHMSEELVGEKFAW